MVYTCFYIFATVISYVINTVAYTKTGEALLAGVSAFGAVLVLCKYLYFNIFFPSEVVQAEMNRLKLSYTYLLTYLLHEAESFLKVIIHLLTYSMEQSPS
jgi:hypothetical protein